MHVDQIREDPLANDFLGGEEPPHHFHVNSREISLQPEISLTEDRVEQMGVVVESVLQEERSPALVDVAQSDRWEENIVQGSPVESFKGVESFCDPIHNAMNPVHDAMNYRVITRASQYNSSFLY